MTALPRTTRKLPFAIHQLARFCLCLATFLGSFAVGQEKADDAPPIPTWKFTPPPPPKEVPAIVVEASTVLKLPTHQITVLRGAPSTLPDIPAPPASKPLRLGPVGEPRYLISISATVYDHSISHIRWFNPKTSETYEAWCGWDWTLLSPLPRVEIGNQLSYFHLLSFNIDTTAKVRFGRRFEMPKHPEVAPGGFVITKGNPDDPSAQALLGTLRDYYLKYKPRLILIKKAQEQYQAGAIAWQAAHPPKPENHTFWLKPHRGSRYLAKEGGDR